MKEGKNWIRGLFLGIQPTNSQGKNLRNSYQYKGSWSGWR